MSFFEVYWVRWSLLFGILTTSIYVVSCTATPEVRAEYPNDAREIVILLHGLARSKSAMWLLAERIEDAGFRVERIGYDSLDSSLKEIVEDVAQQIDACCAHGTQPVHFVGHSLGGLIIRAYLAHHQPLELGRVVLIGTPNQGTPVVDYFRNRWWLRLIGAIGLSLGTGQENFPRSLPLPDYPVDVIAGESDGLDNESVLPGRDDGLVPIESTKLEGMADFILIQTSHSMMRYDKGVAAQTVAFLRTGRFEL